jgi:uncharacterized protein with FMN-binding domain
LLKIVLYILGAIGIIIIGMMAFLVMGLSSGKNLQIGTIDFSTLRDGVYHGAHKAGRWTNEVAVTVAGGRVTNVSVTKDVLVSNPDWKAQTLKSIVDEQTLQVDIISGATVTMKAYLKAVENALDQAR